MRHEEAGPGENTVRVGVLSLDRDLWSLRRFGIGEPLVVVGFDVASEPAPGLARSWERAAPGRWRFHLRENVRFHDGTPLDADRVARVLRGYFDAHWADEAPPVKLRAEKVDARAVDVITPYPGFDVPRYLGRLMILTPESFAKDGVNNHPVGTGPWRVERLRYGDRMTLVRNPHYWGGVPRLERISVRQIAEHQTRVLALEAGDLDWSRMILRQDIARLGEKGYPTVRSEFLYDVFVHFNTEREPVNDVRVRQAISYALDRERIAAGPFEGTAEPASTLFPRAVSFYAPGQRTYGYDPGRARALLEEAGWRAPHPGGIRVKDGRELVLPLLARGNRPAHLQSGEIIQHQLRKVGIRVEIQSLEIGAWIAKVYGRGDFVASLDGRLPSWWGGPLAFVLTEFTPVAGEGADPRRDACRLHDERLAALVRRALGEEDETRRTALLRAMQEILAEQQPWVILVHDRGRETFAASRRLSRVDTPFTRMFAFPGPATRWRESEE